MDQISARFFSPHHNLFESVISVFEIKITHRPEQLAGGTYIKGGVNPALSCAFRFFPGSCSCLFCGFPDKLYRSFDCLLQRISVGMEFQRVRAECVCQHNVAARLDISPVDRPDLFRTGQIPRLRKFSRGKSAFLKERPHPAVEEKQLVSQFLSDHILVLSLLVNIIFISRMPLLYRLQYAHLRYAQSVLAHASQPAIGHRSLTGLAPITAVTDFVGVII